MELNFITWKKPLSNHKHQKTLKAKTRQGLF
jgi:hypothetical protein